MELNDFFALVGGDCEQVLDRLPGEAMIRRFLGKFLGDPAHGDLTAALAAGDLPTAFRAAHTMKGTAATLGLDDLASAASALTEALRNASAPPPQALVAAVDAAYQRAVAAIGQLEEGCPG